MKTPSYIEQSTCCEINYQCVHFVTPRPKSGVELSIINHNLHTQLYTSLMHIYQKSLENGGDMSSNISHALNVPSMFDALSPISEVDYPVSPPFLLLPHIPRQ